MRVAEAIGLVLAVLAVGLFAVVVRRRLLQRRGGTVELALRLKPQARSGGWVLGVGRFVGDDLDWYRIFSLSPRPRRRMSRPDLQVLEQRPPRDGEARALSDDAVVMTCRTAGGPVELGLASAAVTGFLAWLESQPPGVAPPPVWSD